MITPHDLMTATTYALRRTLNIRPADRADREPHEVSPHCAAHHCHSHDLDEPITPGRGTTCGECFHYYPTDLHLWIDYQAGAIDITRHEWRNVRTHRNRPTPTAEPTDNFTFTIGNQHITLPPVGPPPGYGTIIAMMIGHLFTRPGRITFCPHCIHDL